MRIADEWKVNYAHSPTGVKATAFCLPSPPNLYNLSPYLAAGGRLSPAFNVPKARHSGSPEIAALFGVSQVCLQTWEAAMRPIALKTLFEV